MTTTITYNVLRYELHRQAHEQLAALVGTLAGPERRRWPAKKPMLTIRCPRGHAAAKVYESERGALFVAWPVLKVDGDDDPREGILTTGPRGSEQELADLVEVDPDGPHPALYGWCRCGQFRSIERHVIVAAVRAIRTGRTSRRILIV